MFKSSLLGLVLLLLASAVALARGECVTKTCPLSPYQNELALRNQAFCGETADIKKLQRTGNDCADLDYCCASITDFRTVQAKESVRLIGLSQRIDAETGSVNLPASRTARLEFDREACVARLTIATVGLPRGAVRLTRYYLTDGNTPALESTEYPLGSPSNEIVLDECRVLALSISAPVDLGLRIAGVSFCLLDTSADACGVCNGDGSSCDSLADVASVSVAETSKANIRDISVRKRSLPEDEQTQAPSVAKASSTTSAIATSQEELWNSCYAVETAKYPIRPFVRCHHKLGGGQCFSVFGYENKNNATVYVPSERNSFLPKPAYRGQPHFFIPGGEDAAFGVVWNCTAHRQIHLSWNIESSTTQPAGEWPNKATVHRGYSRGCPEELSELV